MEDEKDIIANDPATKKAEEKEAQLKEAQQKEAQQKEAQLKETQQKEAQLKETLQKIKATASEEDPHPSSQLSLRTILGGDLLTTQLVRSQLWLFVLIVVFAIIYVAVRYQCQQDMLTIDQLENELKGAKYKSLSSSSTLVVAASMASCARFSPRPLPVPIRAVPLCSITVLTSWKSMLT